MSSSSFLAHAGNLPDIYTTAQTREILGIRDHSLKHSLLPQATLILLTSSSVIPVRTLATLHNHINAVSWI